jgi:hypothetical protein
MTEKGEKSCRLIVGCRLRIGCTKMWPLIGYFLNVMPAFIQGGLGSTANFTLKHGPRLSLLIFSTCVLVNTATFCFLSDRPVLAGLIARLEMLLLFFITAIHATVININLGKLIRSSRNSKRMEQSQIHLMQKFQTIQLIGVSLIVALPIVQIIEACIYWDYYMDFPYDWTFSGADIYPVHFVTPFVAVIVCPLFLEQKTARVEKEAPSTVDSTPTEHNPKIKEEELGNATKMANAAIQNWVESNSNLTASL